MDDLSFEVYPGESIAVLGRNGSGKSTTLKLLSGVLRPSEGWIGTQGRVAGLLEVGAGFHPNLTGRENVYLNAAILGMSRQETDERFEQILEFSEIGEFIDTEVKRYSSGMYSRLGFSVAVHTELDVLLVDEILSVGDAPFRAKCNDKIAELQDQGKTMFIVSHNAAQVKKLCQRGIVLDKGRKVFDGAIGEAVALMNPKKAGAQKPAGQKAAAQGLAAHKAGAQKAGAQNPVVPKPASQKPAVQGSAAQRPAAQKPAAQKPAAQKPAVQGPGVQKPAAQKAGVQKPAVQKAAAQKPAVQKPGAQKPAAQKPAAQKPAAQKPAAQKPGAQKPGAQKPAVQKPSAQRPAAQRPAQTKTAAPQPAGREVETVPQKVDDLQQRVRQTPVPATAAEGAPTPAKSGRIPVPGSLQQRLATQNHRSDEERPPQKTEDAPRNRARHGA